MHAPMPYHAVVPEPLDYASPPPTRTPARHHVAVLIPEDVPA